MKETQMTAYALNELQGDEREKFESDLASDQDLQRELESASRVADGLAQVMSERGEGETSAGHRGESGGVPAAPEDCAFRCAGFFGRRRFHRGALVGLRGDDHTRTCGGGGGRGRTPWLVGRFHGKYQLEQGHFYIPWKWAVIQSNQFGAGRGAVGRLCGTDSCLSCRGHPDNSPDWRGRPYHQHERKRAGRFGDAHRRGLVAHIASGAPETSQLG